VSGLFAAGLILLALAAVADFAGGRFMRAGPLYLFGAAGSACLAAAGAFALTGRSVRLGPSITGGLPGPPDRGGGSARVMRWRSARSR
jgi:hypothetical protein